MSFHPSIAKILHGTVEPMLKRLQQRAVWWPLGVTPWRASCDIQRVRVQGRDVELHLPAGEGVRQQHEIMHLYLDDPYGLRLLPKVVKSVIDIGGNIGWFSILARHYFPEAVIHCYEPNPDLHELIRANTSPLGITLFPEGVMGTSGRASMKAEGDSLEGSVAISDSGQIPITSIAEAIARIGGSVDLLKMDCEGGEWSILEHRASLAKVKYLALEYHLHFPGGKRLLDLVAMLGEVGFHIDSLREAANPFVGQLTARNSNFSPA